MPQGLVVPGAPSIGGKGQGLVVPGAAAAAVAFVPTALATMKRYINAGKSGIATTSGVVTSITDLATPAKSWTTNSSGPALISSNSNFGASIAAFRAQSGSGPGQYGRLLSDISDLAGANALNVMMTVNMAGTSQQFGRNMSQALSGGGDYNTAGCFDCNMGYDGNANYAYDQNGRNGTSNYTLGTSYLLEFDCDGTNFVWYINGVQITSVAWNGPVPASAILALFLTAYDQTALAFGDVHAFTYNVGNLAAADRLKLEAFHSWDATGSGALVPASNPYKNAAP